jgi:competence protein ComEC
MLIFIVAAFVAGVWLLQQQSSLPAMTWFLVPACLLIAIVYQFHLQQWHIKRILIVLTVAWLGFFYAAGFATLRLSDALPRVWEQQDIEIVGVVATLSEVTHRGERFRFDVEQVITPNAQVPKHIALTYYQHHLWQPLAQETDQLPLLTPSIFSAGQRWRLTVRLKRPHTTYNPHGFDFEAWALAQNIRAMGYIRNQNAREKLTDFVWRPHYMIAYCREKIGNRITQSLLHQPYAGVIRALVIGDHSQINAQDWEVFLRTGVNHLMSISGLHISMLAGLAFGVTAFIWRRFPYLALRLPTNKAATIAGALAALSYACLAGLSIPTQRALYMLATFAVTLLLSRRVPIARVLVIALMVVVLLDPWAVIAPGFWLSFSAVAVIAYATVNRLQLRYWLVEAANTQWSVTLGLLPLLILMFGQASIVSPLANAFAIPAISLLVVPLAIIGALLPFDFILTIAQCVLEYCMQGLGWLANLPFATWQQASAPMWAIGLAIIGVLWILLPRGFPQRWLGFMLMLPMLFVVPEKPLQGEMQVTVLDVGQGLSVVVKTANHTMVYDTGDHYNEESDAGKKVIMPYLRSQGINQLDALVISHDDKDHSGGAASILAQMPIKWLASSYTLSEMIKPMPTQLRCYAGQQWAWDGVVFEVLYPMLESDEEATLSDNNRSCVIKVTSRYGSVLLTGDIEKEAEAILLQEHKDQLKSDVIIAPHHGSKTSSTTAFIKAVSARHVVFTVGYLNRFKHPRSDVIKRYLEKTATSYRSDYHGAVVLDFKNSGGLQVNAWRSTHAKYWHDQYL